MRFEQRDWSLRWREIASLTPEAYGAYVRRIVREHIPGRLKELNMTMGEGWKELLEDEGIAASFYEDIRFMAAHARIVPDWERAAGGRDLLIFEAGQGLALDEGNRADFPYLTPSRTGSYVSAARIAALAGETETSVCYVTRSYLTRHGAGPLPTQCSMEEINPGIRDLTNVPNPHQESIRYGRFDSRAAADRIERDFTASARILPGLKKAVLVTHLNETGGKLAGDGSLAEFIYRFDRAWLSFHKTGQRQEAPGPRSATHRSASQNCL